VFGSVLSGPSEVASLKISFYFDKVNLERFPKLSGGIQRRPGPQLKGARGKAFPSSNFDPLKFSELLFILLY